MYFIFLLVVHSILCIVLISLVLLQQGKGADAGATFGGGGGNTVFGAAGSADFITKLTTSLAIGFMVTSILLIRGYQHGGGSILTPRTTDVLGGSVMEEVVEEEAQEEAPAPDLGGEDGAESAADENSAAAAVDGEAVEEAVEAVEKEVTSEANEAEKSVTETNSGEEAETSS